MNNREDYYEPDDIEPDFQLSEDDSPNIIKNEGGGIGTICAIVSAVLLYLGYTGWSIGLAFAVLIFYKVDHDKYSKAVKAMLFEYIPEDLQSRIANITIKRQVLNLFALIISVIVLILAVIVIPVNDFLDGKEGVISKITGKIAAAQLPPYITIEGRTVSLVYETLDGDIDGWAIPFESAENSIVRGYQKRSSNLQYVDLGTSDGNNHRMVDCTQFVDSSVFTNVISDLYAESENGPLFITEVWHIVTQLNTYTTEKVETPRYPLETFIAGGGDCEDLAILFASMIKAAPVEWKVELVYMDIDNPTNPRVPNHVMVRIDTNTESYFIDTTNSQVMTPFTYVNGWYYEI